MLHDVQQWYEVIGAFLLSTVGGRGCVQYMAESGMVQAVVIVLGVFAVIFLCSLFKSRPRPEALTGEQLDEIRIRREAAKEASVTAEV